VSAESMPTVDAAVRLQCAWCADPLPGPTSALVIVHGSGGEQRMICSGECLSALVAALAGLATLACRHAEGVRN